MNYLRHLLKIGVLISSSMTQLKLDGEGPSNMQDPNVTSLHYPREGLTLVQLHKRGWRDGKNPVGPDSIVTTSNGAVGLQQENK